MRRSEHFSCRRALRHPLRGLSMSHIGCFWRFQKLKLMSVGSDIDSNGIGTFRLHKNARLRPAQEGAVDRALRETRQTDRQRRAALERLPLPAREVQKRQDAPLAFATRGIDGGRPLPVHDEAARAPTTTARAPPRSPRSRLRAFVRPGEGRRPRDHTGSAPRLGATLGATARFRIAERAHRGPLRA